MWFYEKTRACARIRLLTIGKTMIAVHPLVICRRGKCYSRGVRRYSFPFAWRVELMVADTESACGTGVIPSELLQRRKIVSTLTTDARCSVHGYALV